MTVQRTETSIADSWDAVKFKVQMSTLLTSIGYVNIGGVSPDCWSIQTPLLNQPSYIKVTTTTISTTQFKIDWWMGDAISSPNTLRNQITGITSTFTFTAGQVFTFRFLTFRSDEIRLVSFIYGDNTPASLNSIGVLIPTNKNSDWPSAMNCVFIPAATDLASFRCINPSTGALWDPISINISVSYPTSTNLWGFRDLVKRIEVLNASGILAQFSSDVGILAANGLGYFGYFEQNGEIWAPIRGNNWSVCFRVN